MWATAEIKKEAMLERDYLQGITEKEWRSARLLPWYDVYPEYYENELKKFREIKPQFDAIDKHKAL